MAAGAAAILGYCRPLLLACVVTGRRLAHGVWRRALSDFDRRCMHVGVPLTEVLSQNGSFHWTHGANYALAS